MQDYIKNYEEAVEYICRIPRFHSNHSLKDIEYLLGRLDNPDKQMKIVHVAGTNGKGSTCAYMAALLQEAGYRVGLFTSPHLTDMRERFQINGEMITRELFLEAVRTVWLLYQKEALVPCFFDVIFLTGMYAFSKEQVDILILETGLGGRLDATNAVAAKVLTLITHIGLDHTEQLGNSLDLIAGEKAGIMKVGVPCIVGLHNEKVAHIFWEKAAKVSCPCRILSDVDYSCQGVSEKSVAFLYYSSYYGTIQITLGTQAVYQIDNACLALVGLEQLMTQGIVDAERLLFHQIQKALLETIWPGRMEEIMPDIYVDGAHNADGMRALIESVRQDGCKGHRILIFAAVSDKDLIQMADIIQKSSLFSRIILTRIPEKRGDGVIEILQSYFQNAIAVTDIGQAVELALRSRKQADRIYIAGSLYLAGHVKAGLLKGKE